MKLKKIQKSTSLFCSDVRTVLDEQEKEALLTVTSPDDIALLLCPRLLKTSQIKVCCGSGPPYTAQVKDLMLQDNVSVSPHMLSAAPGSIGLPPQPFPPQALLCKMRVLVVARRRVSKRLLFLDLAPLSAAGDADVLSRARRAFWHDADTQDQTRYSSCHIVK